MFDKKKKLTYLDDRLYFGEAWMICNECGAKLYSFDGNEDKDRPCPKMIGGECMYGK